MKSEFLINEPPLQVSPTLALELGLKEAIVLQQIHYWLNFQSSRHFIDGNYWVRYIPEHWECHFSFWDQKTLCSSISSLESQGVLSSFQAEDSSKTKYYRINYWILSNVTRPIKSQFENTSISQAYDRTSFDAINSVDTKEDDV
jgi:hypothetical protein